MPRFKPETLLKLYDDLDSALVSWPIWRRYWRLPAFLACFIGFAALLVIS